MANPVTVTGWKIAREDRAALLERFSPKYERVIADHVTLRACQDPLPTLPDRPDGARIIGRSDDGSSLECLVVELDGTTDRPDGSTFHITRSLGPGRHARESNDVLRSPGWEPFDDPLDVVLEAARF